MESLQSLPLHPAAVLVLDTNVVLDLFYFRDRRCDALAAALSAGRCQWVATEAMRDEIDHVVARGLHGDWPGSAATVQDAWRRWATMARAETPPPRARMRCTDPDDQKFIDLALQIGASALLSADRAVLRLARHGRLLGLEITTVERWSLRMG